MLAVFILFIASLLAIIGLVAFQAFQIRSGKVSALEFDPEVENPLSRANIVTYKNTFYSWLEARTRKTVLYALRFSIKVGYFVKMKLDAIVSGVHRKAASHERKLRQEEGADKTFFKTIGEYKDKITKKKQ
jgi:hypothetical protein